MKISHHASNRMRERLSLNHNERRRLFKLAMKRGKIVQKIKNQRIHDYLANKQKFNSRVRLYQGYVFVYSKNSHQLYTMYKLPDYLESELKK